MKSLEQWFSEYGKSHQNPKNKLIHYFCVPLIFYSVLGILDAISQQGFLGLPLSLTLPLILGVGLFYLFLNFFLGLLTLSLAVVMVLSFRFYPGAEFQLYCHLLIFIVSWVFQFIGHKIEGQKPSFLEDVKFLLIGPAWLLSFIYKKLGIKY